MLKDLQSEITTCLVNVIFPLRLDLSEETRSKKCKMHCSLAHCDGLKVEQQLIPNSNHHALICIPDGKVVYVLSMFLHSQATAFAIGPSALIFFYIQ